MKDYKTPIILVVICISFFMSTNFALADETMTTASVLDLETKEGISASKASTVSDYLRTKLFKTNKFTIVTRENMEQILKEQQFQLSGCTSQECIVEVGQLLGVRKMFAGSIGKVGDIFLLNLKLTDVQTGKIEKAEVEKSESEKEILEAVDRLVNKIAGPFVPLMGFEPSLHLKFHPLKSIFQGLLLQDITDEIARELGLPDKNGVYIKEVPIGWEKAYKKGDVIIEIDGKPVKTCEEIQKIVENLSPEAKVPVKLLREGKYVIIYTHRKPAP